MLTRLCRAGVEGPGERWAGYKARRGVRDATAQEIFSMLLDGKGYQAQKPQRSLKV
jgi:hypothetical protein